MEVELSIRRVPETDEYAMTWKEEGRIVEDKTYYTNDLEDARLTLADTLKRAHSQGHRVHIRFNSLTGPLTSFYPPRT